MIIESRGKNNTSLQVVKLYSTENRIHDMMNKSTTENLRTTKNFLHKITRY